MYFYTHSHWSHLLKLLFASNSLEITNPSIDLIKIRKKTLLEKQFQLNNNLKVISGLRNQARISFDVLNGCNAIDVSLKSVLLYESAITNPSFSLYSQLDQIAVCKGQDVAWHELVFP